MNLSISTVEDTLEARRFLLEEGQRHYRDLPWRRNLDPWGVLISEVMLQQTQVARVIPAYERWMTKFPSPEALASSSREEVLRSWSGLGYNRRAIRLHECARAIAEDHGGRVPNELAALESLPAIGSYTARAILAFAFDKAEVFLETNIRAVLIRHFFEDRQEVAERELAELAGLLLDREHPRIWYWALMDYGAHLKHSEENYARRAQRYRVQSPFHGSLRQARGSVLRILLEHSPLSEDEIILRTGLDHGKVRGALAGLAQEGFLVCDPDSGRSTPVWSLKTDKSRC
ncbi:MAG: A/G-specific adenine glycosylase [Rectinemataceae bacterium]|nr:A/G-specific adenine glycosylase [Spirochaetaceae bacterium]